MFKHKFVLLVTLLCTLISFAQQDRKDRIIASYMIAFGQEPQQSEINYWMTGALSNQSVTKLVEKHRQNMKNNKEFFKVFSVTARYDNFNPTIL